MDAYSFSELRSTAAGRLNSFSALANSANEIGYADGKKPIDSIVIVPTKDDAGRYYGNEYLQVYRRLEPSFYRLYRQMPAPTITRPSEISRVPVQQL